MTSAEGSEQWTQGCFIRQRQGPELRASPGALGCCGLAAPPFSAQAPLHAAHYLLGCRYWCVNMFSSLSNQPALFLSSFALL